MNSLQFLLRPLHNPVLGVCSGNPSRRNTCKGIESLVIRDSRRAIHFTFSDRSVKDASCARSPEYIEVTWTGGLVEFGWAGFYRYPGHGYNE